MVSDSFRHHIELDQPAPYCSLPQNTRDQQGIGLLQRAKREDLVLTFVAKRNGKNQTRGRREAGTKGENKRERESLLYQQHCLKLFASAKLLKCSFPFVTR
jgi:hypothetical protein